MFDHIAPPYASQLDIYRMIGEEIVQMSFEVRLQGFRDSTAVSSRMDRPERARLTRSWAAWQT